MSFLAWSWAYPVGLAVISAVVALAERVRPWRPAQGAVRPRLGWDLLSLVLHGHVMGVWWAWLFAVAVQPWMEPLWQRVGLPRGMAGTWPWWVQTLVALVVIDFIQWWVHRALHAVPWLWTFHKVHHSIADGEMDWVGSFRFHWMETIIYRTAQYVPLTLLGFAPEALMVHALLGTLVGHLNHANLDVGHSPLVYVFNTPRMHLWHHARDARAVNFGIIFSVWDWAFRTAVLPPEPPPHLGFEGDEALPRTLPGQWAWPLWRGRR